MRLTDEQPILAIQAQMERLKPFFFTAYLKAYRTASSLWIKKGRAHARSGARKVA